MAYEEWKDLSLYHGMRSKRTPEQIKKEGFCTKFITNIEMKREIILALKHFGKEKLATVGEGKGYLVQSMIREALSKRRNFIWATTREVAGCEWWSQANPEIISLLLQQIDIEPEKIDKYLSEKFGNNCYNVKLKITSKSNPNFNTGLDCIPPSLIDKIEKCECKYTGKAHKKKD